MNFAVAGISLNPLIPFLWAMFVGLVFSTVGAAGGILAGVGHMSLFGIPDANMIKPMNQLLVIVSPLVAIPAYWRQQRVVFTLGFLLGLGSISGSLFGSWYSKSYLPEMRQYQLFFSPLVVFISLRLFYETTTRFQEGREKIRESSRLFESRINELQRTGQKSPAEKLLKTDLSFRSLRILFLGQEFSCHPAGPILAGFLIAVISSALGIGGGFLLVPFMASWLQLPMFIVAGTSAVSVLIASVTSVGNYFYLGVRIDWLLVLIEVAGVIAGSLLGPWASRYMKERWLRFLLAAVLLYIGIAYLSTARSGLVF